MKLGVKSDLLVHVFPVSRALCYFQLMHQSSCRSPRSARAVALGRTGIRALIRFKQRPLLAARPSAAPTTGCLDCLDLHYSKPKGEPVSEEQGLPWLGYIGPRGGLAGA